MKPGYTITHPKWDNNRINGLRLAQVLQSRLLSFWGCSWIFLINFLQKVKTITGEKYVPFGSIARCETTQKASTKRRNECFFFRDNVRLHNTTASKSKILWTALPDLTSSVFFSFSNLKIWLDGKRFGSNMEVITETNARFEDFDKVNFFEGMKRLEYWWI